MALENKSTTCYGAVVPVSIPGIMNAVRFDRAETAPTLAFDRMSAGRIGVEVHSWTGRYVSLPTFPARSGMNTTTEVLDPTPMAA